jgi:hypothetical protein
LQTAVASTLVATLCLWTLFSLPASAQTVARDPDLNNDGIVNALDVSRASGCYLGDVHLSQPSLAITTPLDGAHISSFTIDVAGTLANAATLTVNGAATAFADGGFVTTVAGLAAGPNLIEAVAAIADAPVCWDADFNDSGSRFRAKTGSNSQPTDNPTKTGRPALRYGCTE